MVGVKLRTVGLCFLLCFSRSAGNVVHIGERMTSVEVFFDQSTLDNQAIPVDAMAQHSKFGIREASGMSVFPLSFSPSMADIDAF